MKDSESIMKKLSLIQDKINSLKTNTRALKNNISTAKEKVTTISQAKEPIVSVIPPPKTPVEEKNKEIEPCTSIEKQSVFSPTLSACIVTTPSFIDIESDGYSITNDFIQLYNGKLLRCPSLTLAGTFYKVKDKPNLWDFMDAEMVNRGRLRRMSSFLELIIEGGNWTHFTCKGKIRLIGNLDNNRVQFNKQIVAAKGTDENNQQSELVVKSYTPITINDINESVIFVISFMSRQSHILEIMK
jgi:hypothetical protein